MGGVLCSGIVAYYAAEYPGSRQYLSDPVKEITDLQLTGTRNHVKDKGNLTIFFKGFGKLIDEKGYLKLQYKGTNLAADQPSELIEVMFDRQNKILRVVPIIDDH